MKGLHFPSWQLLAEKEQIWCGGSKDGRWGFV